MTPTHRPAGRVLRATLLFAAFLLLLATVLLLAAPAGLAARLVAATTPDVRLFAPSGRLLNGSADLLLEGRAFGRLAWRLDARTLLRGRLGAALSLTAPGHDARGRLLLTPAGAFRLTAFRAEIREATLDAILRPYAIEPSGKILVPEGTAGGRIASARVTEADALARWSGGLVRYRLGGGTWTTSFPPLRARLRVREGAPVLRVLGPDDAELLDVTLRADGWVDLRVRYRFVALAGYPWPDPPAPDVIVIEISEQVL